MSVLSDKLQDVFMNIHNKFVDVNSRIDELFDTKAEEPFYADVTINEDFTITSETTYGDIFSAHRAFKQIYVRALYDGVIYYAPLHSASNGYRFELFLDNTQVQLYCYDDMITDEVWRLTAISMASVSYVDDITGNISTALDEAISTKADKTNIVQHDSSMLTFAFGTQYNTEIRAGELEVISLWFLDGGYESDYTAGISFDSGEIPTVISYTTSGILNWVGTDCAMDSYVNDEGVTVSISIFQPSPNTHYDIVFYFNGTQFIGLVNGFVPATGNEAV